MSHVSYSPFVIDCFSVQPDEFILQHNDGTVVKLPQKSIEVLCYLAQNHSRVISRNELIDVIWLGNKPVGDKSLTNAIWSLRKVLSEKSTDVEFIETIRKSGYKLLVEPKYIVDETSVTKPAIKKSLYVSLSLTLSIFVAIIIFKLFNVEQAVEFADKQTKYRISKISQDPGREIFPVTSPDGRWLAYIWVKLDQSANIYLQDLKNSYAKPKQITHSVNKDSRPIWSKDSTRLIFSRHDKINKTCQIQILSLDTGHEHRLTDCAINDKVYLSLSLNGNELYFMNNEPTSGKLARYSIPLSGTKPASLNPSCLTGCNYEDTVLAFSPNGEWAIEGRFYQILSEKLYLRSMKTNSLKALPYKFEDLRGLSWMSDNRHVVIANYEHGVRTGYMLNTQSEKLTQLNIDGFSYPQVNLVKDEIYYHDWQQNKFLSYITLSDDFNSSTFPLIQSEYKYSMPHYSQQLNKLIFISNESGYSELWLSDKKGQNRQQLTHLKSFIKYPKWSNDGRFIAFLAPNGHHHNNIKILELASGDIVDLNSPFDKHSRVSWAPNNSAIIVSAKEHDLENIYQIDIATGKTKQLTYKGGVYGELTDEQVLYFSRSYSSGLWRKNLKTGENKLLLTQYQISSAYNWTIAAGNLFYAQDFVRYHLVNRFELKSKQIKPLIKLPIKTLDRLSSITLIEADGTLILSQSESPQVNIKRIDGLGGYYKDNAI